MTLKNTKSEIIHNNIPYKIPKSMLMQIDEEKRNITIQKSEN